jgi:hypothetical protein
MGTDDVAGTGNDLEGATAGLDEESRQDEPRDDDQDATAEPSWAAEEARQDSDMTIGGRAAAELPEGTETG